MNTRRPTPKQAAILKFLQEHPTMTKAQAVELIGDYYYNADFHVGDTLSRMVARGMIIRVSKGVYAGKPPPTLEFGKPCP